MKQSIAARVWKTVRLAPRGTALAIIKGYKLFLSPVLPPSCRFYPTCSEYCTEAVSRYGVLRGGWLGLCRLLRCHPFSKGGFDPVRPEEKTSEKTGR